MIDAQTGSGCVGRVVARCMEAPASSMRPKFGSRPAATAGEMTSSDAPSRHSRTTRGCSAGSAVTVDGGCDRHQRPEPCPSNPERCHDGKDRGDRKQDPDDRPSSLIVLHSARAQARERRTLRAPKTMTACPSIGSARGSSAVRRPDAWSQVITAAVPLRTAALHVSRRRLIQPGGDGSTITIWRST